jgi:choice-of-anchor A domain-containing protein
MIRTALTALAMTTAVATAAPFTEWNLLVRNNLTSTSHVDGSALVGGNVSGTSVFSMHGVTASNGAGLMVGGSVSGNNQMNNSGNLFHGGSISGTIELNGGGSQVQQTGIGAVVNDAFAQANAYSSFLRDLAPTGNLNVLDGTKGTFNSVATVGVGSDRYAVYSMSQSVLGGMSELNMNFGSADIAVINFDASATGGAVTLNMNFIGGINQNNSGRIVWNFFNATTLNIGGNLSGMILGTGADLFLNGPGIYGTVVVDNVSQMNSEVRRRTFEGDTQIVVVPLPPAAWAGLAMLGGIAGVRAARRR